MGKRLIFVLLASMCFCLDAAAEKIKELHGTYTYVVEEKSNKTFAEAWKEAIRQAQFMNMNENIQNPSNTKSMKGYLGKMLDKKATTVIIARQTRYGVKVTIKRSKSRRL